MSASDLERIATLEANHQNMSEQISDLKDTVINGFNKVEKKIESFVCDADKKYASKTTETLVYGMVALVLTAFIGGVIFLVFN